MLPFARSTAGAAGAVEAAEVGRSQAV